MIQQPTIDTDVDHPSQTKPSRLKPASQPYLIFLSVSGRVNLNGSQSSILSTRVNEILLCTDIAQTYLQPHYGNGVFGNVYLSAGQH